MQKSKHTKIKKAQHKKTPKAPKKTQNTTTKKIANTNQSAQKAYKLLSESLNISHSKAKSLIDRGLVSADGKKLMLARIPLPKGVKFSIRQIQEMRIIHKDEDIMCVDKPAFMDSYEVERECQDKQGKEWKLLHRLDKETSGCLLLVKENSDFAKKALDEFVKNRVYKLYNALVSGIINDEQEISLPLLIHKGKSAKTIAISQSAAQKSKNAKSATTHIAPRFIQGKKTLLDVRILTGRTHQIRAHLQAIGHPLIGDTLYGGLNASRLMLHASEIRIFEYVFTSKLPSEFDFRG